MAGMKKKDIFFLIFLTLAGMILMWCLYFVPDKSHSSLSLVVRQNGKVIETLPLDQNVTRTVSSDQGHTNVFQIKDGLVTMEQADCSDHTCVNTGSISQAGQSIVCLPNKLVLQIEAGSGKNDKDTPDAVVH